MPKTQHESHPLTADLDNEKWLEKPRKWRNEQQINGSAVEVLLLGARRGNVGQE